MSMIGTMLEPPRIRGAARGIPPLVNGDRLTQPEFHRRYEAMPPNTRAELIGGIVYMASPLRNPHGKGSYHLSVVLGFYQASTPGVEGTDNATTILSDQSEPQPDVSLRLLPERGGQTHENEEQYLVGAPELIVEIAHSSRAIDLHVKKEDYRKAGVREYLVHCIAEKELRVFDLQLDKRVELPTDEIFRSRVFPGLWIDAKAAVAGDLRKLLATVSRGLKSPEHAAFVKSAKTGGTKKASRRRTRK